jgi:hypothetical protein
MSEPISLCLTTFDEMLDCEDGLVCIPRPPNSDEDGSWSVGVYYKWEPVSRTLTDGIALTTWRRTFDSKERRLPHHLWRAAILP